MKTRLQRLDLRLGFMGRLRCEPGWCLDAQWARGLHDYDLWYIWAGRGRMVTSDGEIELHPGRGVWMRPGRRYEAEQDLRDRLGVSFVHFSLKSGRRTLDVSEFKPPVEIFDVRDPAYFNAVLAHVTRPTRPRAVPAEMPLLVKALLLEVCRGSEGAAPAAGMERHHREAITRAFAMLEENPAAAVGELARRSGYSLDHFSRVFQQVTGETPKDCAVRLRMERAMTLLRESSQGIGQIADSLGYRDAGFFSRQFKQKIGLSPAAFRRSGAARPRE
jgi:AraC-like DNA-binding protein